MNVVYSTIFDDFSDKTSMFSENRNKVFEIIPNVFKDDRGYFMEVVRDYCEWPCNDIPLWMSNFSWIRQINRSSSKSGVIRGCHAQKGVYCQGKLVEAVNEVIFDIITDMRPESKTFGYSSIFKLDPIIHNLLWVPRGFLHSFCVPLNIKSKEAIFQYYCDNSYNHVNEFGINPMSILPKVVEECKNTFKNDMKKLNEFNSLFELFDNKDKMVLSPKDSSNIDFETFTNNVIEDYEINKISWYK